MSSEIRSMLHAVAGFAIRNGDTAPSETLPEATERAFLIRLIAYRSLEFLKSRVLFNSRLSYPCFAWRGAAGMSLLNVYATCHAENCRIPGFGAEPSHPNGWQVFRA